MELARGIESDASRLAGVRVDLSGGSREVIDWVTVLFEATIHRSREAGFMHIGRSKNRATAGTHPPA